MPTTPVAESFTSYEAYYSASALTLEEIAVIWYEENGADYGL
jgi:hypothetical protein